MTLSFALRTVCLGLAATAFFVAEAQAADALQVVSRNPVKDDFTSFPKQIHLTFNEPLKATGAQAQLIDPDGRRIRLDGPTESKDGLTVTPEVTGGPPVKGPYELTWQAASASGAPAQGRYTFFVQ